MAMAELYSAIYEGLTLSFFRHLDPSEKLIIWGESLRLWRVAREVL